MHTISGLAGFLALERIQLLAQTAERLLEEMRLCGGSLFQLLF